VDATGRITGFNITSAGGGYTSSPLVSIPDAAGTGAGGIALINDAGQLVGINLAPIATVSTPGILLTGPIPPANSDVVGVTSQAGLVAGLNGITLVGGGGSYQSAPSVIISGGGGYGASAIATIDATGAVNNVTLTSRGYGYTELPTVSLVGGGGTGATVSLAYSSVTGLGGLVVGGVSISEIGAGYTTALTTGAGGGISFTGTFAGALPPGAQSNLTVNDAVTARGSG
jgi:hypothetical protein